jgi:hypothetical protein
MGRKPGLIEFSLNICIKLLQPLLFNLLNQVIGAIFIY